MRRRIMWLVAALAAAVFLNCGDEGDEALTLAAVNDFTYWLQDIDLAALGSSRFDLAIIDYSRDGGDAGRFTADEVATLQDSAGGPKLVLSYISIGEAEDYRWYWKGWWRPGTPSWLGPENPQWPGNYPVRFWDERWRELVFQYLDRILAAGFDGAYLDRVDVYEYWERERPTARAEMAAFVGDVAAYCRARDPGFLIVPQNGHELIDEAGYASHIDGLGSEDNYYDDETPVPPAEVAYREGYLDRYIGAGKKVLAVDYCREAGHIAYVYGRARRKGYVPYCTVRELDRVIVNPGFEPD